jgi:UrcA family protein
MSYSTLTTLLAAAILATGSASAALAADRETASTAVHYGDLNLGSQAGAKTMLQRINAAANKVCEPQADIGDLTGFGEWRKCVSTSIRNAVQSLDAPMVTAAYGGKTSVFMADAR